MSSSDPSSTRYVPKPVSTSWNIAGRITTLSGLGLNSYIPMVNATPARKAAAYFLMIKRKEEQIVKYYRSGVAVGVAIGANGNDSLARSTAGPFGNPSSTRALSSNP